MSEEYSIRTQYRRIRIKYIRSTIAALIDMLLMPQKYLEKIPLSFFKNIKNSVESELVWEKDSEREMAGITEKNMIKNKIGGEDNEKI